jgi:hypothetical protein
MKTVIILGAGASIGAGFPTAADLTKSLIAKVSTEADRPESKAILLLYEQLRLKDTAPDFETIAEFLTTYSRLDKIAPQIMECANREVAEILGRTSEDGRRYISSAAYERIWLFIYEMIDRAPETVNYLECIADLAQRESGLTIATLNYDMTVERACENRGCACSTGGIGYKWTPRPLTFPSDAVRLFKLHGSVNWAQFGWGTGYPLPGGGNPRSDPGSVMFGPAKMGHSGPFMDGYSFSDEHVNELVRCFVNRFRGPVYIIDPGFPSSPEDEDFGIRQSIAFHAKEDRDSQFCIIREPAETALAGVLLGH